MRQTYLIHGIVFVLSLIVPLLPALPLLPDPAPVQPFFTSSPPTTIPAFPEQSDLSGCPLDLPQGLFPALNHACGRAKNRHLNRVRCCPILATWLYTAYSATALGRAGRMPAAPYDLPVLPDDSETCVENLEKALRGKGIELARPNDTCDAVYCYCGIRLHVPTCTGAFQVSEEGSLVGDARVSRLERDCQAGSGLGGCTKCLKSLHQLNGAQGVTNGTESERKNKMHDRDCELMGLTWLLAKNRTAYFPTVTAVLRAIMMVSGVEKIPTFRIVFLYLRFSFRVGRYPFIGFLQSKKPQQWKIWHLCPFFLCSIRSVSRFRVWLALLFLFVSASGRKDECGEVSGVATV